MRVANSVLEAAQDGDPLLERFPDLTCLAPESISNTLSKKVSDMLTGVPKKARKKIRPFRI